MRRRIRWPRNRAGRLALSAGAAAALGVGVLFGASSGGSIDVFVGSTPTPTSTPSGAYTCDRTAADATALGTQVTAASNGQVICLTTSADYGTWNGTNKTITLAAQDTGGTATSPTMALNLGSGDSGFTIDGRMMRWDQTTGMKITGCTCAVGLTNVTFKNFHTDGGGSRVWNFDPGPSNNSGITIDHAHFYNNNGGEAVIYIDHSPTEPGDSGLTIKNSLFRHLSNDGIKLSNGAKVTILNNKFMDFHEAISGSGNHTDAIQFYSGDGSVLRGNWVIDADQCISGFDGEGSISVTHNVVADCDAHALTMMADTPASTLRFNTVVTGGEPAIICGNKSGLGTASVTNIYDNIAGGVTLAGDGATCTPTRNDHNMFPSGASGSNFNGTPTFVGGASPLTFTSFADYCLTGGSAGITGASDGTQVGACGGDYNASTDGPPTGEGY